MTLVVEDGTGLANAESLCTLQFVKDYHAALGFTWVAADPATEAAMRRAVAYMVQRWYGRWYGRAVNSEQALPFPRVGIETPDGFTLAADSVPLAAKQMQAELTLSALAEDLAPDQANPGTLESKTVKVGPIEKSTKWVGGQSFQKVYTKVLRLSRQLASGSNYVTRA